jgi:hypothetical protein
VKIIARRIGVTETDVIYMNRRLGGDASLNAAIREDGDSGEWQDWLVDESPDQETTLAASEEFDNRRKTLSRSSNAASFVMPAAANQRQAPPSRSFGAVHGHERSEFGRCKRHDGRTSDSGCARPSHRSRRGSSMG